MDRTPLQRYFGFIADSSRWVGFEMRPDDVVITTPGKCGTTLLQNIIGMLLLGRVDLGQPLSELSPWLDMLIRPKEEVYALLEAQTHRRFIKTHTTLDGLPWDDRATYITSVRHPIEVALSCRDHMVNIEGERTFQLRTDTVGTEGLRTDGEREEIPEDPAGYVRWWFQSDDPNVGTGLASIAAFSSQVRQYWEARDRPNLHLFHFMDLVEDRHSQVERLANILELDLADSLLDAITEAASFESMRSRAAVVAPDAELEVWVDPAGFFMSGGRRDWSDLFEPAEVESFATRFVELAGDGAASWVLRDRQ